jgi:vacuolar-type H+-ATPase subunit I/STV1
MREFAAIIVAGIGSSMLGGAFGGLVGWLSPELINTLAQPQLVTDHVRFAVATGLVAGLFIGAAAMGFGLLVGALRTRRSNGPLDRSVAIDAFEPSSSSSSLPRR